MKKIIFNFILIPLIISPLLLIGVNSVFGQDGFSYFVMLKYDHEKDILSLEKVSLIRNSFEGELDQQLEEGYLAKVISFDGKTLYSLRFLKPEISLSNIPSQLDPITGEQLYPGFDELIPEEPPSEIVFSLNFPYLIRAEAIEFYDPEDSLLFSVDLSEYQLCTDNMENCEDILISYHQQEIERLKTILESEEEILIHQKRIEDLQETRHILAAIEKGEKLVHEIKEKEKEIRWQNIFIILGIIILFGFIFYFVRKRYFLRK